MARHAARRGTIPRLAIALGVVFVGASASASYALPALQLDILGGTYDSTTQTTISSGDAFSLAALLVPSSHTPLFDNYYISAAVIPKVPLSNPPPDLGSFTWNGIRYDVTSDMVFGTPPLDESLSSGTPLDPKDAGDLPQHGIFPTYFTQFRFQFSPWQRVPTAYNTADGSTDPKDVQYIRTFQVNTSGLAPGYAIHFDLYDESILDCGGDVDVDAFAPFSHDAESCGVDGACASTPAPVPEPASMLLLGSGLIGAGWRSRRRSRRGAL